MRTEIDRARKTLLCLSAIFRVRRLYPHAFEQPFGNVAARQRLPPIALRAEMVKEQTMFGDTLYSAETHHDAAKEFAVVKRSVVIDGHKTSVSLEDAFWMSLKDIASHQGITLSMQISSIDEKRRTSNLSSAIRLFVLEHFRTRANRPLYIGERQSAPSLVP
jgi:predicted DNA-binding ribbon-helix-helix protein